jgi:hypothetical protein
MATNPVRVPSDVHAEVQAASRLMGCTAPELLERAWRLYRETAEFKGDFEHAQKAFAVGDVDAVATRLYERGMSRAHDRAAAVRGLRREYKKL